MNVLNGYLAVCATSEDLALVRAIHHRLEEIAGSHAVVSSVQREIPRTSHLQSHTSQVQFQDHTASTMQSSGTTCEAGSPRWKYKPECGLSSTPA
jgi:hypothetical protein